MYRNYFGVMVIEGFQHPIRRWERSQNGFSGSTFGPGSDGDLMTFLFVYVLPLTNFSVRKL